MESKNLLECLECRQEFKKGTPGSIVKNGIFLLASYQCFCSEGCRSSYFIKKGIDSINDTY